MASVNKMMTDELLEILLNEDEGSSLDFKRDQYAIDRADKDQKSELLKDILAFANSWRQGPAFILIGVQEVKGGRSQPVGISEHLEDAVLQQIVSSNVTPSLEFRYYGYPFEGHTLGVIEIPKQRRPFYAIRDYGKVKKDIVYFRRGSSTSVAKPEEVARMGSDQADSKRPSTQLTFGLARTREDLGLSVLVNSQVIYPVPNLNNLKTWVQKYSEKGGLHLPDVSPLDNEEFSEELLEYVKIQHLVSPLDFRIENTGSIPLNDIEVEGHIPATEELLLLDNSHLPVNPKRHRFFGHASGIGEQAITSSLTVERFHDSYEVRFGFDRLLPGKSDWTATPLYVGAGKNLISTAKFSIFAQELKSPLELEFEISIEAEALEFKRSDWEQISESY